MSKYSESLRNVLLAHHYNHIHHNSEDYNDHRSSCSSYDRPAVWYLSRSSYTHFSISECV